MAQYKIKQEINSFGLSCGNEIGQVQVMDLNGNAENGCDVTLPTDLDRASSLTSINGGNIMNNDTIVMPSTLVEFSPKSINSGCELDLSQCSSLSYEGFPNVNGVRLELNEGEYTRTDSESFINDTFVSKGYSVNGFPYVWKDNDGNIVEKPSDFGDGYVGAESEVIEYGEWQCKTDPSISPESMDRIDENSDGDEGTGYCWSTITTTQSGTSYGSISVSAIGDKVPFGNYYYEISEVECSWDTLDYVNVSYSGKPIIWDTNIEELNEGWTGDFNNLPSTDSTGSTTEVTLSKNLDFSANVDTTINVSVHDLSSNGYIQCINENGKDCQLRSIIGTGVTLTGSGDTVYISGNYECELICYTDDEINYYYDENYDNDNYEVLYLDNSGMLSDIESEGSTAVIRTTITASYVNDISLTDYANEDFDSCNCSENSFAYNENDGVVTFYGEGTKDVDIYSVYGDEESFSSETIYTSSYISIPSSMDSYDYHLSTEQPTSSSVELQLNYTYSDSTTEEVSFEFTRTVTRNEYYCMRNDR